MPLTGSRHFPPTPSCSTVGAVRFDQHRAPQLAGASRPTAQDSHRAVGLAGGTTESKGISAGSMLFLMN